MANSTRPVFEKIMPEFPLADVAAGVTHYRDVLGFTINYQMDGFAVMDRDRARILLISKTEQHKGIASCYIYVADADTLHAELVAKGANVEAPPVSRPWGLREFRVFDPEGNILTLGQPFQ
ncbi:MAG: VOC family protein [Tepidisphaeraceae bacterium]